MNNNKPYANTKQKLKVLSFFSGAMGLDLGLEKAGIETILACESDKWAQQTIRKNKPNLPLLGDIWEYNTNQILNITKLNKQNIDIIAGGPPCQAFSTMGARRGFEDTRGNVFLHFIKIITELQPRYAVIENVRGLLSMPVSETQSKVLLTNTGIDFSEKHGAIKLVTHLLKEAGYTVTFNLYNAANFGTPQLRERVVIIATKNGEPVPYLSPTHSNNPTEIGLPAWVTVKETISNLPNETQQFIPFPPKRLQYFKLLTEGQYWKHLPDHLQREALGKTYHLSGGRTGFYRRLAWDKPSPTLVTHPAMPATGLGHPTEDRPLSVGEYKLIQQFPTEWVIEGNLKQQYKQIGNAVPLGLGEAIGRTIVAHHNNQKLFTPEGFKFSRYKITSNEDIIEPK